MPAFIVFSTIQAAFCCLQGLVQRWDKAYAWWQQAFPYKCLDNRINGGATVLLIPLSVFEVLIQSVLLGLACEWSHLTGLPASFPLPSYWKTVADSFDFQPIFYFCLLVVVCRAVSTFSPVGLLFKWYENVCVCVWKGWTWSMHYVGIFTYISSLRAVPMLYTSTRTHASSNHLRKSGYCRL